MAKTGGEGWEVTALAPRFFYGDLRPIPVEHQPGELCRLVTAPAYLTRLPQFFFYGRGLRDVLREHWDLVHCWEEPYVLASGQVAWWRQPSASLVFYTFQNIAKRYPPPLCAIERMCLEGCTGWTASGEAVARAQSERGWQHKPFRVMPLGVDVGLFRPDRAARREVLGRLGWNEKGPPVVGFLGRFVKAKGLGLLMSALEAVKSPWRALWVGGGPMERELRAWAARHGDRVRVVGGVTHDAVPAYVNAMDLLAAPSQTTPQWREQFGRMLIEAFACAVPVIGSDSGEIPYVVADAGVIVGERDEAGWGRALSDLLESPARRAELATRGLDRARTLYAWPIVARRHLDFFDELLGA